MCCGQELWATAAFSAGLQVAWEWAEIGPGLLALRDPMDIMSNVVLVDARGRPVPDSLRAVHLNNLVYQLDWRCTTKRGQSLRLGSLMSAAN
jgi:hypothetical protein